MDVIAFFPKVFEHYPIIMASPLPPKSHKVNASIILLISPEFLEEKTSFQLISKQLSQLQYYYYYTTFPTSIRSSNTFFGSSTTTTVTSLHPHPDFCIASLLLQLPLLLLLLCLLLLSSIIIHSHHFTNPQLGLQFIPLSASARVTARATPSATAAAATTATATCSSSSCCSRQSCTTRPDTPAISITLP